MEFHTPTIIKDLETKLEKSYSLPIFKGYKALDKRGVEQLIDSIYANLPEDIVLARKYLLSRNYELKTMPAKKKGVYEILRNFELHIGKAIGFADYIIVNVKETENLIKQISNNLPEELTIAKVLEKQQ